MGNSAFIYIEYQNEWIDKDGKLRKMFVNDKILERVVQNSSSILKKLRENKHNTIIHVAMRPDSKYKIFGKAKYGLREAIPRYGTWRGSRGDFHKSFTPHVNELSITERSGASAFSGTVLENYLRNNNINKIYLLGFAGHVCVESTLRESHDKGFETHVIEDALLFFNKEQESYFLKNILHHFGNRIKLNDLLEDINSKNLALNSIDRYFKSIKNVDTKTLSELLSNDFKMQGVVNDLAINVDKESLISRVGSLKKTQTKQDEFRITNIVDRNNFFLFDIKSKVGGKDYLDQIYVHKKDGKIKLKAFVEGKEK